MEVNKANIELFLHHETTKAYVQACKKSIKKRGYYVPVYHSIENNQNLVLAVDYLLGKDYEFRNGRWTI